jgi:hypothetical protein
VARKRDRERERERRWRRWRRGVRPVPSAPPRRLTRVPPAPAPCHPPPHCRRPLPLPHPLPLFLVLLVARAIPSIIPGCAVECGRPSLGARCAGAASRVRMGPALAGISRWIFVGPAGLFNPFPRSPAPRESENERWRRARPSKPLLFPFPWLTVHQPSRLGSAHWIHTHTVPVAEEWHRVSARTRLVT